MLRSGRDSEPGMSLRYWWLSVVSAVVLASCKGPVRSTRLVAVSFVVESDPGVRLPRARVTVDGDPAGESDSNGIVQTKIRAVPGQRLMIQHQCPAGHAAPSEHRVLRLRRFEGLDGFEPPPMEITLRCVPTERIAAFVIKAENGPDLPVLLNGESVARTNGSGIAHFSTRHAAGTDFKVVLDTRDHPHLLPQLPTRLFTLTDAEEIFVFEESFEVRNEPRRRTHRRPRITKIE